MCGIAGILRFDGKPVQQLGLSRILDKLQHRGSDSVGLVTGSAMRDFESSISKRAEIGLGHRRLSIIDLSDTAAQPMSYADGLFCLTFNGEIYNYIELRNDLVKSGCKFRTESDTEVILAAYQHWGESCVEHFNGMFAFALWDEKNGKLFCARDPIGIKPFYYILNSSFFAFASESSALAHITGKSLNRDAIAAYLLCMYVPGPWSIFESIYKLQPGYVMTVFPDGQTNVSRYWRVDRFNDKDDIPAGRQRMKELLTAAVCRQLRSDVPVGAFLSGGIDSSMVVALASECGATSELHTFSVGYEGHYINELPYARQVAERYGTRHHELKLTSSMVISNLDKSLAALNEPIADSAIVPTYMLSEMAVSEGVKVLLNGTGGDEVFGGYGRYVAESVKRKLFESLPFGFRTRIGNLKLLKNSTLAARFRNPGFDMMLNAGGSLELAGNIFDRGEDFSLFIERLLLQCCLPFQKDIPVLYNRMLFDLNVYLVDELLVLLDQMTMSWTLEGRVPLLDKEVVCESFRFPPQSHVNEGKTKKLLTDLATPYLGAEFVTRKKQGFGGPVSFWVSHNLKEMIDVITFTPKLPFLEKININKYQQKIKNAKDLNNTEACEIFYLYCFTRWFDRLKEI